MPNNLTVPYSDFVPQTVIKSAEIDANFDAIETFVNTTKLNDDNLQNAGITRSTKLKTGTAHAIVINDSSGAMSELAPSTSGYFLATRGASLSPVFIQNPVTVQYTAIVGSSTDVTNGVAQYSSIATAISALSAGDSILILKTYSSSENITITKQLYITGQGRGSRIDGTVTFNSASDYSYLTNIRVTNDITLSAGADGVVVTSIWLASGKSFSVSDSVTGEFLQATQET